MIRTRKSFSIENDEKIRYFCVFFGKIGAMPKIPAHSGYVEKNFFFRKHTSLYWEQDAENRIEKY
tara:strand:- start:125 stop:319 length:195 start_codon:yes stop_codon:yes gene_type:complete